MAYSTRETERKYAAPAGDDISWLREQAIGQAVAPFWYDREDRPHPDWVGEWSYWFVSGAGCLVDVLPGHEDDPRLVRYDDWTEPSEDLPPSRCHGGTRGILDLDTPRAAGTRQAAGTWTAYRAFADRYPPALPFHHFAERARTLEPEHARTRPSPLSVNSP
ncbi:MULTISPECIES: hypothetical protein [unclassified Streptomyces]|uniref:hypothetical protein n=1 Tax=unclassified Streptomyces TaxID=2593676 RepID=UPI002DD86AB6|nr:MULTISPECIES: hypothetical protein [unclassified Streptomyces]WSC49287.1 hypothetical protein OIE61_38225 [Streptomyces sp. NBC_01762]